MCDSLNANTNVKTNAKYNNIFNCYKRDTKVTSTSVTDTFDSTIPSRRRLYVPHMSYRNKRIRLTWQTTMRGTCVFTNTSYSTSADNRILESDLGISHRGKTYLNLFFFCMTVTVETVASQGELRYTKDASC